MFRSLLIGFAALVAVAEGTFYSQKINNTDWRGPGRNIIAGGFDTQVNHFTTQNHDTAHFRYYVNLDHYQAGDPLYFYIKDIGDTSTQMIEEGLIYNLVAGQGRGGALLTTDHRYFGDNIPTPTATFEDLQYLTIEQILADWATFITTAQTHLNAQDSTVFVWGSGFGGTISAWLRKKYPHIVDFAWSSNGLFAFEPTSFGFYDILQYNIYFYGGQTCLDRVHNAFDIIEYLLENGEGEYLQSRLNLCQPLDTDSFTENAFIVETLIKYISDHVDAFHVHGIRSFCRDMNAIPNDALNSFVRWYDFVNGDECEEANFGAFIEDNSQTSWEELGGTGIRSAYYLQCTQLGFLKEVYTNHIFPEFLNDDYLLEKCRQLFGPSYNDFLLFEANFELEVQFGGLYQRIENIIYSNGLLHGWLYQGILVVNDRGAFIFNINHHSIRADLQPYNSWDSYVLNEAKAGIQSQIRLWLN